MLRIWGRPTSTCTMRVLWTCAEAGVPFDLTLASATMGAAGHVSRGGAAFGVVDTPAYRAMNPNGTIPTIDDGGFVLWESNAIVGYVAQTYAPAHLFGADARRFALGMQWMGWENEHLEPPLHTLVMELVRLDPDRRDASAAENARQRAIDALQVLDGVLTRQPYLAGDRFSMADIPTGIGVHRWLLLDLERPSMPALEAWHERLTTRRGFREHVLPADRHLG